MKGADYETFITECNEYVKWFSRSHFNLVYYNHTTSRTAILNKTEFLKNTNINSNNAIQNIIEILEHHPNNRCIFIFISILSMYFYKNNVDCNILIDEYKNYIEHRAIELIKLSNVDIKSYNNGNFYEMLPIELQERIENMNLTYNYEFDL